MMRELWGVSPHELNTQWTAEQVAVVLACEDGWREKIERAAKRKAGSSSDEQVVGADEFLALVGTS